MGGPTTEVLNNDLHLLRDEVHRVGLDVRELGAQIKGLGRIDLDVRELSTKVAGILTFIKVFGVFSLASVLGGVWWGGALTTKVDGNSVRIEKLATRIEKFELKVDAQFKEVNARFDRLEAAIGKLIEQSKPAVKP